MDQFKAAEIIKQAWLEQSDRADSSQVILLACPYCGKTDRMRPLQGPPSGEGPVQEAWQALAAGGQGVGLCGFCLNLVLLRGGQALMPGLGD